MTLLASGSGPDRYGHGEDDTSDGGREPVRHERHHRGSPSVRRLNDVRWHLTMLIWRCQGGAARGCGGMKRSARRPRWARAAGPAGPDLAGDLLSAAAT